MIRPGIVLLAAGTEKNTAKIATKIRHEGTAMLIFFLIIMSTLTRTDVFSGGDCSEII
jgi:hypothetical protein